MSAIDPGMSEGIEQSADQVQPDKPDRDDEEEEEEALAMPSRWWFASTACPLLAGTFGPMASGFNICSLAYEWREYIPPGGSEAIGMQTGNTLKDPPWEIALNAISLFAAVVGNVSLLLNMARRLRFSIAQPVTIHGFLLAGILLLADVAALGANPATGITRPEALPPSRRALTHSFYFAAFAGAIYIIIGLLMCLTVYGASKDHYPKNFRLTPPQRTLMLQTMAFIAYLLLGSLVYSNIEGWAFVNTVYWADTTLLTVGLGDYAPASTLGRGLLFPFAIGGILMVGLVVGSIRSLILERGKQKISARIVEKRRSNAVHNVDKRRQTIKISFIAKADFSVDPGLSPAQRREEEFNVMRKVQRVAERERRYFALATSTTFALILWFVGAAVFQQAEYLQQWSYMEALYFSYTSLLTIGYGDYSPHSNAGKAFFVLWSLLAVPSLTILISNMGDTIVKWFSDFTIALGAVTVLPEDKGIRHSLRRTMERLTRWSRDSFANFTLPGVMGAAPLEQKKPVSSSEYHKRLLDRLAGRLQKHLDDDHKKSSIPPEVSLEQDVQFYHYVLARECRDVQKDLDCNPPKQYKWAEWEYFLKLMGNGSDSTEEFPGQQRPNILVPEPLRAKSLHHPPTGAVKSESGAGTQVHQPPNDAYRTGSTEPLTVKKASPASDDDHRSQYVDAMDGNIDRQTSVMLHWQMPRPHRLPHPDDEPDQLRDWSWLSNESPLMSTKSEAEWILERLSAALERELNRQRKGYKRKPPIRVRDAYRRPEGKSSGAEKEAEEKEEEQLRRASESEE